MDDLDFARLVFAGLLSIQYHPRNDVKPEDDVLVIDRCLRVTVLALGAFNQLSEDDLWLGEQ